LGIRQRLVSLPAGRVGKWVVLACWLAAVTVFGTFAGRLEGVMDNDETNWLPASAESTRAIELAEREFPAEATTPLLIVYARDGGLTAADHAAVAADRAALSRLADGTVPPPRASADRAALLLTVPVATAKLEQPDQVRRLVGQARTIVGDDLPDRLTAKTTGPVASRADAAQANSQLTGSLAAVTLGVVTVVLLVAYRSPLLLLVPLFCVGVAAAVAQGGTYLLSAHAGVVVSGTSAFLLTVLVFGVGTDYGLLLISRYREELRRHADRHTAMAAALDGTVGSVLAAAATVALTALVLLTAEMNSTRGLGPVAAIAVAAAMLAMTTLLPALLVTLGRWLFWPRIPRLAPPASHATPTVGGGPWGRVAALVGRRPRRTWMATALLLACLTGGVALLQVGGLTAADNYTRKPEFLAGQELVTAHFPAGSTAPAQLYLPTRTASAATAAARSTPGVASVQPAQPSATGAWQRIDVVLSDAATSQPAQQTIQRLRHAVHRVDPRVLVGGPAATSLDTNQAMDRDLRVVVPIILVVAIGVLGVLLRAVVAPLLLLGCVLASAGAAAGASALLFHAAGFPRTDQTVLLLGVLFLVALGVDYTIFLMGRARQEVATRGHRHGILHALTATGAVITSAGLVLAATFSVFTITPVVLNIQLGAMVAIGVLIDTFVVRTLLVPALTLDIGAHTWWPGHLAKRVDLDDDTAAAQPMG
jgi:putative drug exporter of the RND superfamily